MQPAPDEEPKKQERSHPERHDQPDHKQEELDFIDLVVNAGLSQSQQELNAEQRLPPLKPGYIRQIIDFSPSTAKTLRELAKDGSVGDTLRDAIALSKWFKDTREKGGRILVERNGKVYEVITVKYPSER